MMSSTRFSNSFFYLLLIQSLMGPLRFWFEMSLTLWPLWSGPHLEPKSISFS